MTTREFARLVREMRGLQKRYFAGERSSELLRQARDVERRVDRAADGLLDDCQRLMFLEPEPGNED